MADAVSCAVEIQRDLAERNAGLPDERKMQFRIGVNLGDVIDEEDRIYGASERRKTVYVSMHNLSMLQVGITSGPIATMVT